MINIKSEIIKLNGVSGFAELLIKKRNAAMPPRPPRVSKRFTCKTGKRYVTSGYDGMC